jgi:DoxX-like protein
MISLPNDGASRAAARWLRWGVAFVWLWTGLAVLHPHYRELGTAYLAPLGLPAWVMYATCAAEVLLGLRVALGRAATWVTVLQIVMIAGFTAILSGSHPALWLDPLGMLSNNLALVVMIGSAWLLEREGWSARASRLLPGGLAAFWLIDGLLHSFVTHAPRAESIFLVLVGWQRRCELAVAVFVFLARFRGFTFVLYLLLCLQVTALLAVIVVAWHHDPSLWFHPFGPLTKNVAVLVATFIVMYWCEKIVNRRRAPVR